MRVETITRDTAVGVGPLTASTPEQEPRELPGTADVYAQLRALTVGVDEGWFLYVAGQLADGKHIVDLTGAGDKRAVYRTLLRGEPFWWTVGVGDGHGYGDLVQAVLGEEVPELLTPAEAAERMPGTDRWDRQRAESMTSDGITYNLNSRLLYPLYGAGRLRYVFAAQIEAESLARQAATLTRLGDEAAAKATRQAELARKRWAALRQLLPPTIRPSDLAVDVTPRPSPSPLPVRAGRSEAARRQQALMIGDRRGWFKYVNPPQSDGPDVYVVEVVDADGALIRRELPPVGVLPWVGGVADQRRQMVKVAWRAGLGD